MTFCNRAPATSPGRIALAQDRTGPSSMASVFVRPITPHLARRIGAALAYPIRPASDEMVMMTPAGDFFRCGMARRVT